MYARNWCNVCLIRSSTEATHGLPYNASIHGKSKRMGRGNYSRIRVCHPSASQKRNSSQSVQTNLKVFEHHRQIAIHVRVACKCGTRLDDGATRPDSTRLGSTVGVFMSEIVTKSSTCLADRRLMHKNWLNCAIFFNDASHRKMAMWESQLPRLILFHMHDVT